MAEIPVTVDPGALNSAVAAAVLESALGRHINKAIEEALDGRRGFGSRSNVVDTAMDACLREIVEKELRDSDDIKRKVRERLAALLTDDKVDALAEKAVLHIVDNAFASRY